MCEWLRKNSVVPIGAWIELFCLFQLSEKMEYSRTHDVSPLKSQQSIAKILDFSVE